MTTTPTPAAAPSGPRTATGGARLVAALQTQGSVISAVLVALLVLGGQLSHDAGVTADASSGFQGLSTWSLFGLPISALTVVLLYLVVAAVVRWTPFGRQVLAIGGNEDASRLMGLRVDVVKTAVYVISGGLAGLAGVFLASQTGSVATGAG